MRASQKDERTIIKLRAYWALPRICFLIALMGSGVRTQGIQFRELDLRRNILEVADNYARQEDWPDAIMQYYEYLYRFPDDTLVPVVYFKIAALYEQSGQLKLAEKNLRQAVEKCQSNDKYDLEARLRWSYFLYKNGRLEESLKFALCQKEIPFRIVEIYALLGLDEYELADSLLTVFETRAAYRLALAPELKQMVAQPAQLPWYRKWGAVGLSAVLPGSGRIFLGDYWNGGMTLVGFGGVLAATTYLARSQPQFYFVASTAGIAYYFANLYATYHYIEKYRVAMERKRYRALVEKYPLERELRLGMLFDENN